MTNKTVLFNQFKIQLETLTQKHKKRGGGGGSFPLKDKRTRNTLLTNENSACLTANMKKYDAKATEIYSFQTHTCYLTFPLMLHYKKNKSTPYLLYSKSNHVPIT